MAELPPIYDDHEGPLQADTCQSLVAGVERGSLEFHALVHGHYPGTKLADEVLPQLKTVGFWDAQKDQDWNLDWHRNEGVELTFCETGCVNFSAEQQSCVLNSDEFAITRPWQKHRVGNPTVTACRLHWVILDVGVRRPDQKWCWPDWIVLSPEDRGELCERLMHNDQLVRSANDEMRDCVRRLSAVVSQESPTPFTSRLVILLNELFLILLELLRTNNEQLDTSLSGTIRTVQLFLQDLMQNRTSMAQEWTVGRMASACGMRPTQFTKYCRQLTNSTPAKYLEGCRLRAASTLLLEHGELSIVEVARRCGFSSTQYFATRFRSLYGMPPTAYRISQT